MRSKKKKNKMSKGKKRLKDSINLNFWDANLFSENGHFYKIDL